MFSFALPVDIQSICFCQHEQNTLVAPLPYDQTSAVICMVDQNLNSRKFPYFDVTGKIIRQIKIWYDTDCMTIQWYSAAQMWKSLRWRHNELDGVSNHQPHDYLLNRLFGHRSKRTSKLRVTGLCAGNSPGTGEFPAQRASNAENVSVWWRHHGVHGCMRRNMLCIYIYIFDVRLISCPVSFMYVCVCIG